MFCKRLIANIANLQNVSTSIKSLNSIRRQLSVSLVNEKLIIIQQDDGKKFKFPAVWLRDNCQCSECFHDQTKSRQINWLGSNLDVSVKKINASTSASSITIDWNDNHISTFDLKWLKERNFSSENHDRYIEEVYKPAAQLWCKNEFNKVCKTFEFNEVLQNDKVLLAWLEAIAIQGFALIRNAPSDTSVVRRLAEKIGYIKRTTYGEEFSVKSKLDAQNYAYLMKPLPLHTDMPYFEYKAGINILHYLVQSNSVGGANLMTDGFNTANSMRQKQPEYFDILSSVPVDWYDMGKDGEMSFHNIWRAPVVCLDVDGRLHRINHNTTKRDSHFTVPLEQVQLWYEAYDHFLKLINEEAIEFKVNEGDVLTFNNLRMLHGRTPYEDSSENQRHLVGAYVDWDIIYSKIRILRNVKKKQDLKLPN